MVPFGSTIERTDALPGGGKIYVLKAPAGDMVVAPFDGVLTVAQPLGDPSLNVYALTFRKDDGTEFVITNVIMDDPRRGIVHDEANNPRNMHRWSYVSKRERIGFVGPSHTLISAYAPVQSALEDHGPHIDPMLVLSDLNLRKPTAPASTRPLSANNAQPPAPLPARHDGGEFGFLLLLVLTFVRDSKGLS